MRPQSFVCIWCATYCILRRPTCGYSIGIGTPCPGFAFEFTSPLWTAVLAPLILREMLPKVRIIATIIGFIGIMIIARPGIVEFSPGMIAAASCAIGFAGAAIATRKLTGLQPVATILFWMCAIQSVWASRLPAQISASHCPLLLFWCRSSPSHYAGFLHISA